MMRSLRTRRVQSLLALCIAGLVGTGVVAYRRSLSVGVQPDGSVMIPTGQALTPAGDHIEVSDRPLGMVLSPNGALMAVVTGSNFGTRSLHIIDVQSKTLKQSISIGNSFVGVDFSPEGDRIYIGGGASNDVKFFKLASGGSFVPDGTLGIAGAAPSGLMRTASGSRLYVALNQANQVAVIDTATRGLVSRIPVGTYPYTTVISADGSKVYVSNWGGKVPGPTDFTDGMFPVVVDRRTGIPVSGTVSVIDTASNTVIDTIEVGLHPCGMALSPSGDRLYVTNANSDTVSVIDTTTDTVTKTLNVGLVGSAWRATLLGSSPNAVTVSPDGRTRYVANASQNAVAVVDTDKDAGRAPEAGQDRDEDGRDRDGIDRNDDRDDDGGNKHGGGTAVKGFIPTGWYPTAVALDASGQQLFIANGYGFGSLAPTPPTRQGRSYSDRRGVISVLAVPGRQELAQFTKQVLRLNNGTLPPGGVDGPGRRHPIPMHVGQPSRIKHVFYIIKESRTYDQVFGALPQGNGDPSLVQFGRDVTPIAGANFFTTEVWTWAW
jgi:YVTN family beta-propeller protein